MSKWEIIEPEPRMNYVICNLAGWLLSILTICVQFALFMLVTIFVFTQIPVDQEWLKFLPLINGERVLILPKALCLGIGFPFLALSFDLNRILKRWIKNWLAVLWRRIRRLMKTTIPTVKVVPESVTLGEKITVSIQADELQRAARVKLELIHRQSAESDDLLDSTLYGIKENHRTIAALIRRFSFVSKAFDRLLPKPDLYDMGYDRIDKTLETHIKKRADLTSSSTDFLVTLPTTLISSLKYVHRNLLVLRLNVRSSSLIPYREEYYLALYSKQQ